MIKAFAVLAAFLIAAGDIGPPTAGAQPSPIVLITAEETWLGSELQGDLRFRAGVSRGPSITVLFPKQNDPAMGLPFHLQLNSKAAGARRQTSKLSR